MTEEIKNIELRYLDIKDYKELKETMIEAYQNLANPYWKEHHIQTLINKFPEGQILLTVNGKIAGCALSILVKGSKYDAQHTYREVTGNYSFNTHNPKGDTLYGIDVFIKPEFRGLRLGRRLYDYRKELC